jgi:hypothetical protein
VREADRHREIYKQYMMESDGIELLGLGIMKS